MVSFFDKGPKKAHRNPARSHSKARKMETKGPRDLKLGLKLSLEYRLRDERCSYILFFRNWGLKGLFFDKRSKKTLRNPARRHFVKNADPSDSNFGKIIFWNIFDH